MPMDCQDDGELAMFPEPLTDAILKILMIQERIEEKLDAILTREETDGLKGSVSPLCAQSIQSRGKDCNASVPKALTRQVTKGTRKSKSTTTITKSSSEGLHDSKVGTADTPIVQMRSSFEVLMHRNEFVDNDEHVGRLSDTGESDTQDFSNISASSKCQFSAFIPISPNSLFHLGWTWMAVIVLLAELTYVPYVLAWNFDMGPITIITATFWSIDASISCISGTYNSEGEMNPIRVSARAYALSWFPLDLSIILLDWVSIFGMAANSAIKLLRFSKLARIWRILAILKFSKINRQFYSIMDRLPSPKRWRMVFSIVYLCVSILWFLHIVACFWFLIGKSGPTDTGQRWLDLVIQRSDGTSIDISAQTEGFQYVICFHWSVATFVLGGMEIGIANSFERAAVVAMTIVSFLFGSVFISLLSAIFVDHRTECMETTAMLRVVDRFLSENQVNNLLALRIQKVCLDRMRMQGILGFPDVTALQNLPASLYKDLRYEILGRVLRQHDLFNCWSTFTVSIVKEYSADGVDLIFLKPGDELFTPWEDSEEAYFLSCGELTYSKGEDGQYSHVTRVPAKTWLSEAALWSHWGHVGICESQSPCRIASAKSKSLANHVHGHPIIRSITVSYCQLFCQGLALARPPFSNKSDDICVPFTKLSQVLSHFPNDLRIMISTQAIRVSNLGKTNAAKFEAEISVGKSDAYINVQGELERTVLVMALMVQNEVGHVLYQVGEVISTFVKNEGCETGRQLNILPELKLPGLKQDRGESIEDTLRRLFDKKLRILKDMFEHTSTLLEEEIGFSKEFGVKTRYLRTKVVGLLRGRFSAEPVTHQTGAKDTPSYECRPAVSGFSLEEISLYVMFDNQKPFIYAWLPQNLVAKLQRQSHNHRDEMLTQMLRRLDVECIKEEESEVPRVAVL